MNVLVGEIKAGDILLCYEDIDRSAEKLAKVDIHMLQL